MPVLHLGVIDLAYGGKGTETTGDVAESLEARYHVMRTFARGNWPMISEAVSEAIAGTLETSGTRKRKPSLSLLYLDKIDSRFRDFLSGREMRLLHGLDPILAAEEGISHRFKDASNRSVSVESIVKGTAKQYQKVLKAKRGPRPEFIDTGLYQASFRSWLTD